MGKVIGWEWGQCLDLRREEVNQNGTSGDNFWFAKRGKLLVKALGRESLF